MKTPKDPLMRQVWVMLAALLAFTEDHCGDDKVEAILLSRRLRDPRKRKKFDAYMRDPANREKIIARRHEAAEMLGFTDETRH